VIEIDGSYGEGGGQILRTSLALSALLNKPFRIFNIRKNRPKPGLKAQHLKGLEVVKEFCNAEVIGANIGSMEVIFKPNKIEIENFVKINIGTAGSISLLIQTILPILIFSKKEINVEIIGGTSGLGSPNIEYTKYVFLNVLKKMGVNAELKIVRQGFFPKGGGKVILQVKPINKLNPIKIVNREELKRAFGIVIVSKLPKSFAEKFIYFVNKNLNRNIEFSVFNENALSKGFSSTIVFEYESYVAGFDIYYEENKNEEYFARKICEKILNYERSNACIDKHLADQLLIYMALADGKSAISFEEYTQHFSTNLETIKKFLDLKYEIKDNLIEIDGIGFRI